MGRVSPACTVGAAEGTAGCCPSTLLGTALSLSSLDVAPDDPEPAEGSKGCAAVPTPTTAASTTTEIVRTIMPAPSRTRPPRQRGSHKTSFIASRLQELFMRSGAQEKLIWKQTRNSS